jgi:hypothetical protein|nr:MAG TPA: head closure knob [Caudoviricetes sp.]
MHDVECILLSKEIIQDEIGVEKEITKETPVLIIKNEEIYAKEYYVANQSGYKPTLRLKISALNYEGQQELKYMGITYTIIRATEPYADEVTLICERKIKNV